MLVGTGLNYSLEQTYIVNVKNLEVVKNRFTESSLLSKEAVEGLGMWGFYKKEDK